MKVILTERISTLGNVGEMVNVSAGHARNYLIPNKLAVLADESNKRQMADHQKRLAKKIDAERKIAIEQKKKIDAVAIEYVRRVGANGKLFGAITNSDLAKELEARNITVDRRQIIIENPIKKLGQYDIKVKLFTEVEAVFQVKVTMDPVQAEEEKKKQAEAMKRAAERKEAEKMAKNNPEAVNDDVEMATEEATEKEVAEFEAAKEAPKAKAKGKAKSKKAAE